MKRILFKKNLSLLLAIAMVLTFFPAQAFADSVLTPQEAVAQAIKDSGFTATVKDSTVTVTGSVTNKNSPIKIDIPDGVTVDWKATLSGEGGSNEFGRDSLLNLAGTGDFILDSMGKIQSSNWTAIEAIGPTLTLNGLVSSENGPAICSYSSMDITISGGLVQSKSMNAICFYKDNATVTVTGGSVLSNNDPNQPLSIPHFSAIGFSGSSGGMNVIITGGSVQGVSDLVQPADKDGNPVYLAPVKVKNDGVVFDISASPRNSGAIYEAQTDEDGYAYLWLPAEDATITALSESKSGSTQVAVTAATNSIVNIPVTILGEDVAAEITAYNTGNGGTGTLTTAISGGTVTVTGTLTGVTKTLELNVPENVKVLWKAKLTGTGTVSDKRPYPPLLGIDNLGIVEIAKGAEIINSASKSATVSSSRGSLIMSGGKVTSTGSPGIAIAAGGCDFLMTGGEVAANQANSFAIEANLGAAALTGGTISASGSNGVQFLLDGEFMAYRSGMLQPGSIQGPGSRLSAAICVDQALTSTSPGSATGLTLTSYNLTDGDSLTLQWVPRYDGIGINIYKQNNSNWFIVFPGVNLVVPGSTHTIFYDANGGSGTMNNAEVDDGDDYPVAANSFTRSNYSFAGWNTQANGSGTAYLAGGTISCVQKDIALYAQWTYLGGNGSGSGKSGGTKTDSAVPAGGVPAVNNGIITTSTGTFVSDTTTDVHIRGGYTVKLTSDNGQSPKVVVGTPGVFEVQLTTVNGKDYFVKLIPIGQPGAQAGVYLDGVKLFSATVETPVLSSTVKSDTNRPFRIRAGASYVMKLTSGSRPTLVSGTAGAFKIEFVKASGNDYLFRITSIGKAGVSSGFYVNSEKSPVAVATIA